MAQVDFDLNSVQRYTESFRDMLKQKMLHQELTFRNQVHELHRLYRTQRTCMVDLGWKEFETCDLWDESSQSAAMPVADPARYDQLAVDTRHSPISMVGSAQVLSQDFSGGHHGVFYWLQQRPLDFHLPSASIASRVGTGLSNKGKVWNHSPETMKLKHSIDGGDISDSDDLKLSLSIREEKRRKGATKGKWLHKKTPPYPHDIIDLEQDDETMPDEDANHVHTLGCSAGLMHSGGNNESQVSVLSDQIIPRSVKKDTSHSVADGGECRQEQISVRQGVEQCTGRVLCEDISNMKQGCTLFKAGLLDLNEVYVDDSSCYSNDPVIQRTLNQSVVDSYTPQQNAGAASILHQLCEDLGSHNSDSKMENVESTLEFPEGILGRQQGCRKGEAEDAVFAHTDRSQDSVQDWDVNKSPGTSQQISISDKLSGNHIGPQVAETPSVELGGRSSGSSEVKPDGRMNKGESAGMDIFIQSAAESLIHISLESLACFQECSTKEGSNELDNEEKQLPEYSCDSYEAMTLKLTESNADEYSVSSKPFEVNESEMKDFGLKLRRGRRLKDFQKEILPGLASLARHEISEDINIMEGVLRSREYRRLRGKMADGESWPSPLSRRRSTGKRGGRRTRK